MNSTRHFVRPLLTRAVICALAVQAASRLSAPRLLWAQCPGGTPPPCGGARSTAISPRSIAVLYFANRSADSSDQYLADGLTEEIISRLTKLERLQVKSRTAVERFRESQASPDSLGRALRVAQLVSGTVQRSGSRLRVSVELVRASTGVTAWAGQFDRADMDLLDIQAAIADTVAHELAGRLLPREHGALRERPTTNPEAYDRFLRGSFRLARRTPEDVRAAIREFEAAVRLDPAFAEAHARIALAYGVALDWGWMEFDVQQSIRTGLAASARALELDSSSADAWTSRGYILRFANARTYSGVREAFDKAIALAPRDAEAYLQYGWALAAMGEQARAVSMLQRATALDPERSITRFTLAMTLILFGRPSEALLQLDSALANDPTAPNLHGMRAWARLITGDVNGARADAMTETVDLRLAGSALAAIQVRTGDTAGARLTAQRMVANLPPPPSRLTWGAVWQAGGLGITGQTDRVLDMLDRIEPQGLTVWLMSRWPAFDAIRSDPRFARFTAELAPPGAR